MPVPATQFLPHWFVHHHLHQQHQHQHHQHQHNHHHQHQHHHHHNHQHQHHHNQLQQHYHQVAALAAAAAAAHRLHGGPALLPLSHVYCWTLVPPTAARLARLHQQLAAAASASAMETRL
ncbi:hypothetical protein O3M35_009866 [Rhynocoris fuscipes]|uniref:Uncharacterized protein n=1 Tax=Rhynocoris fuscipes TaxID=488301 RepID=A0AAW1D761_9HEMI